MWQVAYYSSKVDPPAEGDTWEYLNKKSKVVESELWAKLK